MSTKLWRTFAITAFKYLPMVTASIMVVHVGLLLLGISLGFAETICGVSIIPLIIAYAFSKGFGFCWMHRMFIDYTFKINICIQWLLWIGFGVWLTPYRWIMFILGIEILVYFFFNLDKYNDCNKFRV